MGYILDYLNWRGDLSFDVDKVNEIDMVSLSFVPLLDLEGIAPGKRSKETITLKELMVKYNDPKYNKSRDIGLLIPYEYLIMLTRLSNFDRFKDLVVRDYLKILDYEKGEQLSCVTLTYEDKYSFVIFSGTDDSTIGWKENFEAMYVDYSKASLDGVKYLNKQAIKYPGKVYVFGHSKGGNISLISTIKCSDDAYKRIERTYSFDGQGIPNIDKLSEKEIARFKKVYKIAPDSSIVGRIFTHLGKTKIVKSSNKGVHQHDAMSWELVGKKFNFVKSFNKDSDEIKELLDNAITKLTLDEKQEVVRVIYGLCVENEIKTLLELRKKRSAFIRSFMKLSKKDRKLVSSVFMILFKEKAFRDTLFDGIYTGIKTDFSKQKKLKKNEPIMIEE